MEKIKEMTKAQFVDYARKHNFSAVYSGKLRKFFITKIKGVRMNASYLHGLINSRT